MKNAVGGSCSPTKLATSNVANCCLATVSWPKCAKERQAGARGERGTQGVTAAKCFVCKCEARDREEEREREGAVGEGLTTVRRGSRGSAVGEVK